MKEVLPVRINKLLSNYGYCSRKQVNRYIKEGAILVNGVPAFEGQWVTEEDSILFLGEPVKKKPSIYYLYHKPPGVICTLEKEEKNGLASRLPLSQYAFPVGRLDKDSEGLLLFTNDGDLAQKLLHGEGQVEKEYHVTVKSTISDDILRKMSEGVDIGIGITKPCQVKRLDEFSYSIILTEGMNRQIRRMAGHFGHEVIFLKRIRILSLTLSDLKPDEMRALTKNEVKDLYLSTDALPIEE